MNYYAKHFVFVEKRRKGEKTRTISNFLPKIQIKRNQDLFRCASKSKKTFMAIAQCAVRR